MASSDWLWYLLARVIEWSSPIVYAMGLAISVWAYRRGRKKGYIGIAVFFALAVYACTLAPHVNEALARRFWPQPEPNDERTAAYNRELQMLYEKYHPQPAAVASNVYFPLGAIILVAGLWSVAKQERKTSEPGPPADA